MMLSITVRRACSSCCECSTDKHDVGHNLVLWFEINGKYRLELSRLIQILLGFLVIFIVTTLIFHYRISILEADRDSIRAELTKAREEIQKIRDFIHLSGGPNLSDEAMEWPQDEHNEDYYDDEEGEQFSQKSELPNSSKRGSRLKREVQKNENDSNILSNNSNTSSVSLDKFAKFAPLETLFGSRTERNRRLRERERGNNTGGRQKDRNSKNVRLVKKLKARLEHCRRRCKPITGMAKHGMAKQNVTASSLNGPQACFLIPAAPNVDITQTQQHIGPWYLAQSGTDFGFSDDSMWYKGISLDYNRTSIIFEESGLFTIYSQVYYHVTLGLNEKPAPMGYRIYLKKNEHNKGFQRPISLAECVPSYPTTFYQTCLTQISWSLEKGDQIYLQHFTKSMPVIEADTQGKTFLGIVRLRGSY